MMVAFGPGRRLFAFLMVVALTTMMATLSACGSADGGQGDRQGDGSRPTTQHHASGHEAEAAGGGQQNTEPAPPDDSSKGTGGGAAGGKVYQVGDAGEVELGVENGRPVLMEAWPNAGWNANVTREGNELKVHFRRGEAEWEFEAEPEHGGIKVKSEPG
jgi:hypothetical protein